MDPPPLSVNQLVSQTNMAEQLATLNLIESAVIPLPMPAINQPFVRSMNQSVTSVINSINELHVDMSDLIGPIAITLLGELQMVYFSVMVLKSRDDLKLGGDTSEHNSHSLIYQAQKKCVEYHGRFVSGLWMCSLTTNQWIASLFGLLYLASRQKFFEVYKINKPQRVLPFYMSAVSLGAFNILSLCGLVNIICVKCAGVTALQAIRGVFSR